MCKISVVISMVNIGVVNFSVVVIVRGSRMVVLKLKIMLNMLMFVWCVWFVMCWVCRWWNFLCCYR